MEKPETYCSGKFLESVYDLIDCSLQEHLSRDGNEQWISELYKFLHGNCVLITDLNEGEIIRRSRNEKDYDYNPNFKKLWKNGGKLFVSYPDTFDQMNEDPEYFKGKASELYFITQNNHFCKSIENIHGIFCVSNTEMAEVLPPRFISVEVPISATGNIQNWSFLEHFRYPSNAAVIADSYILSDNSLLDQNIIEIIKYILPENIEGEYDLTILTHDVINIEKSFDYLNQVFKELLSYEINLSIGLTERARLGTHDRHIITNYCKYSSMYGFNLFKKSGVNLKARQNTEVLISSITFAGNSSPLTDLYFDGLSDSQASYYTLLEVYRDIWKEIPDKIGIYKKFIGERENRLLD